MIHPITDNLGSRAARLARLSDWESAALRDDLPLYRELARMAGGPILELGCGSGRVLESLAETGVSCFGLDRSRGALDRCYRRLRRSALSPCLIHENMARKLPGGRFRLVILARHVFGYLLEPADRAKLLRMVREHLTSDGLVVLDLAHPDSLRTGTTIRTVDPVYLADVEVTHRSQVLMSPEGKSFRLTNSYAMRYEDGTTLNLSESSHMQAFDEHEIREALEEAHFARVNIYGNYGLSNLHDHHERMLVVAGCGPG